MKARHGAPIFSTYESREPLDESKSNYPTLATTARMGHPAAFVFLREVFLREGFLQAAIGGMIASHVWPNEGQAWGTNLFYV